MNATINILELASELAHADLILHMNQSAVYEDGEGPKIYTEKAQYEFKKLYDKYYSIIEYNAQIQNKSTDRAS
jgi:hypothetical protein